MASRVFRACKEKDLHESKILRLANQSRKTHTPRINKSPKMIKDGIVSTQLQALELWRNSLVASVRSDAPDLSARQMALLLCVYLGQGPHTVRGLAKDLKISKPAVSRALDRLGELNYIRRERDDLDRRNVLVQRTQAGGKFLIEFSNLIKTAEDLVATISDQQPLDFALESMANTMTSLEQAPTENAQPQNWTDIAA